MSQYLKTNLLFFTCFVIPNRVSSILPKQCLTGVVIDADRRVNASDLDKFLTILEEDTFDFDLRGFTTKIEECFFHEGNLLDTTISESQMKKFLDKNKTLLEKLSLEHIKKMNKLKVIKSNEK